MYIDLYFTRYNNWEDADYEAWRSNVYFLSLNDYKFQYILLDPQSLPSTDFSTPDGLDVADSLPWMNVDLVAPAYNPLAGHPEALGDYILMVRILWRRDGRIGDIGPEVPFDYLLCVSDENPPIIPDRPTPETGDPPPEDTAPWAPPPQPEPTFPNFDKRYQKWIRVGPDPAETDAPPPAGLPSPTWVPSRASHCHP